MFFSNEQHRIIVYLLTSGVQFFAVPSTPSDFSSDRPALKSVSCSFSRTESSDRCDSIWKLYQSRGKVHLRLYERSQWLKQRKICERIRYFLQKQIGHFYNRAIQHISSYVHLLLANILA